MTKMNTTYQNAYNVCLKKVSLHMENMKTKAFDLIGCTDGDYYAHDAGVPVDDYWSWVASMATGMALITYQTQGEEEMLSWANSFEKQYHNKVFSETYNCMHDVGFLYLPYSVAFYKLTGDRRHREDALKAADELAKRFQLNGCFIEAWDEMTNEEQEHRGIVDSMMNIPLLFWAWKETKHTFYRDIAIASVNTILKNYLREDGSVCHAFFYDSKTGEVKSEVNSCGYANGSHWARGTGWFVYGMAIAYSYTGDKAFLDAAQKAAKKYVECLTEEDSIPVWDFRLPKELPARACRRETAIPKWDEKNPDNKSFNRDSSAASVMSCAFQLLYELTGDEFYQKYYQKMLLSLCDNYLDTNEKIAGMLKRSNGENTYTIFGDYYFLQALAYELYAIKICWIWN